MVLKTFQLLLIFNLATYYTFANEGENFDNIPITNNGVETPSRGVGKMALLLSKRNIDYEQGSPTIDETPFEEPGDIILEALKKRGIALEYSGKRRMGSEFLGKRRIGSEFLGKRRMGSEFLGKRSNANKYITI